PRSQYGLRIPVRLHPGGTPAVGCGLGAGRSLPTRSGSRATGGHATTQADLSRPRREGRLRHDPRGGDTPDEQRTGLAASHFWVVAQATMSHYRLFALAPVAQAFLPVRTGRNACATDPSCWHGQTVAW